MRSGVVKRNRELENESSRALDIAVVLSHEDIARILLEWQARVRQLFGPGEQWALVGIKRRGAVLARRLWNSFREDRPDLEFGEVDVSLYRDDYNLRRGRLPLGTELSFNVEGYRILLIDDVLYTGRTVRAAIDLISDFGRPRAIQLAVLIDRGGREMPVTPDCVGFQLQTELHDRVDVHLRELDSEDCVLLLKNVR